MYGTKQASAPLALLSAPGMPWATLGSMATPGMPCHMGALPQAARSEESGAQRKDEKAKINPPLLPRKHIPRPLLCGNSAPSIRQPRVAGTARAHSRRAARPEGEARRAHALGPRPVVQCAAPPRRCNAACCTVSCRMLHRRMSHVAPSHSSCVATCGSLVLTLVPYLASERVCVCACACACACVCARVSV
jgi:hypothetical protein